MRQGISAHSSRDSFARMIVLPKGTHTGAIVEMDLDYFRMASLATRINSPVRPTLSGKSTHSQILHKLHNPKIIIINR